MDLTCAVVEWKFFARYLTVEEKEIERIENEYIPEQCERAVLLDAEIYKGPREWDPVLALPITPGIFSTNGSSPCCLLNGCLDLWGLEEAIWCKHTLIAQCTLKSNHARCINTRSWRAQARRGRSIAHFPSAIVALSKVLKSVSGVTSLSFHQDRWLPETLTFLFKGAIARVP